MRISGPVTAPLLLLVWLLLGAAPGLRGQVYEASSFQDERFHPEKAFDGRMDTRWSASFSASTGWIQVSFKEPRKWSRLRIRSGIRDLKGAPGSFDILAGPSADKLKLLKAVKGNREDGRTISFRPTRARTWRVVVKDRINPRWSPTISELEFSLAGAGDSAPPAESKGSGMTFRAWCRGLDGRVLARAFDGDPHTGFEAQKRGGGGWIEVTFPEPRELDALMMSYQSESGRGVPRSWQVEYRRGRRWRRAGTVTDSFTNEPRQKFKAAEARVWRIKVERLVDERSAWSPREIKFLKLGDQDFRPRPQAGVEQKKVNEAIDRGVAWLKKRQREDGTFPSRNNREFPMGVMSLGALALRKSGLERDDPIIQDLVRRLGKMELKKTYSVALQAMFLSAVSHKRYGERLQKLADWLVQHQGPNGLWGYPDGRVDVSNTQYALLGLKAAVAGGATVKTKVWQKSWDWFLKNPEKSGGYRYVPKKSRKEDPVTGSMTAAGLACLKICADHLPRDRRRLSLMEKVRKNALQWLAQRFVAEMNPGSGRSHYYYLYGVERVGSYFRLRRLGQQRWYDTGAAHLVAHQFRNGSWHNNLEDTCFALLFLNRASTTGR